MRGIISFTFIICCLLLFHTCTITASETEQGECAAVGEDGASLSYGESQENSSPKTPWQLLMENIFGQGETSDPFERLGHKTITKPNMDSYFSTITRLIDASRPTSNNKNKPVQEEQEDLRLAETIALWAQSSPRKSIKETIDMILKALWRVQEQLDQTFSRHIQLDKIQPLQLWYYMNHQEEVMNPVWKRRVHRYMPVLAKEDAIELADGLYLSHLSYADSCKDVQQYLKPFHNNSWILLNCTVTSLPHQPAHFMAVRRHRHQQQQPSPAQPWQFWKEQSQPDTSLEIVLVIRGTKEFGDILSDGMLQPVDYRGGKAHEGIMQSALWLCDSYRDFLLHLKEKSKRSTIKLWLVGHSLGAGTAALASLEFADEPGIETFSLGFGTPPVLSAELSASVKANITTVINDADCVPRMSGPTIVNTFLDAFAFNWTTQLLDDVNQLFPILKANLPFGSSDFTDQVFDRLAAWVTDQFAAKQLDSPIEGETKEKVVTELIPPGDCIHLYRDGMGYQGVYMPCGKFVHMEFVRSFIDDHLIPTGYYPALLNYVRSLMKDLSWQFEHDITSLPIV